MSKMITTVIIDDHKGCIDTLKNDLGSYPDIKVIDTCTSATKGKNAVLNYRPELLFLDVEMPRMSGFNLLKSIQNEVDWQMNIVFYSAFDKYILEALRCSATDFLLKPYQKEELDNIVERVRQKQCVSQNNLSRLLDQIASLNNKIAVQTVSELLLITKEDVLYFERTNNAWQVVLTNRKKYFLRSDSTHQDITKMNDMFVLASPCYIINIMYIISIENKSLQCKFYPPNDDLNDVITISRRNYVKIKNMLRVL